MWPSKYRTVYREYRESRIEGSYATDEDSNILHIRLGSKQWAILNKMTALDVITKVIASNLALEKETDYHLKAYSLKWFG